jgi:hypothetical protein
MKNKNCLFLTLTVLAMPLLSALSADSTGKTIDVAVSVSDGSYDNPMMVLWLENDNGEFVKTLHMFSKRKTHYEKLKTWMAKSKVTEKPADIDAVSGPTVGWNQTSTISIPAQIGSIDLLNGKYVLCVESRTHIGENYRSLKIPLPEGYTGSVHKNNGTMKSIEITVKDKTN